MSKQDLIHLRVVILVALEDFEVAHVEGARFLEKRTDSRHVFAVVREASTTENIFALVYAGTFLVTGNAVVIFAVRPLATAPPREMNAEVTRELLAMVRLGVPAVQLGVAAG